MDRTLAIAVLGMLAGIALLVWARRALGSLRARVRSNRAIRGERNAEALLESHGFAIDARQAPGAITLVVDGALESARVRCDLLVSRGGRRFVAEVKTGAIAPRLDHPPTRRQLIEYLIAFGADGVLLVDPEANRVRTIALPSSRPPSASLTWTLVGASIGALTVWLVLGG